MTHADHKLDKKEAELIGRLFNSLFNNIGFYQALHPNTQRSIAELLVGLQGILPRMGRLSIIQERTSLYVDDFCLDDRLNARKFVLYAKKIGVQSITFSTGITLDALKQLCLCIEHQDQCPTAEAMNAALKSSTIDTIKINYIVYRKVTADETVVGKDAIGAPTAAVPNAGSAIPEGAAVLTGEALDAIGSFMDLANHLAPGAHMANNLHAGNDADITTTTGRQAVVNRLRSMQAQVSTHSHVQASGSTAPLSMNEMLASVHALTGELRAQLELKRRMGEVGTSGDLIVDEIEKLTLQTIVRLARDEYRQGSVSAARLGALIRKMLPDTRDIKKLLPMLKDGLIADGMPLSEFLTIVKNLKTEMAQENIAGLLDEAAAGIGASLEEIMQGIKENPADAARLIVLASEIRKGGGKEQGNLSAMLTEYVERVSSQLCLQQKQITTPDNGSIDTILATVENQILDKLRMQGIPDEVLSQVASQVNGNRNTAIGLLKSDWLVDFLATDKGLTLDDTAAMLNKIVNSKSDLDRLRAPMEALLAGRGIHGTPVQELFTSIEKKVAHFPEPTGVTAANTTTPSLTANAAPQPAGIQLPKGVLSSANALFFLKHQIGLARRYQTPFSTLMISIPSIASPTGWQPIAGAQQAQIIIPIFTNAMKLLRELDLVGSLTAVAQQIPIIILPMTPNAGAQVVTSRMQAALDSETFSIAGQSIKPRIIVSFTGYDQSMPADVMQYLQLVRLNHKKIEEQGITSTR